MLIEEIKGDLFLSNDNLCHCVSEDFHMGKGIAVKFRQKFGSVNFLLSQKAKIGECAMLRIPLYIPDDRGMNKEKEKEKEIDKEDKEKNKDRIIFYLVTKKRYWGKPTLDSLKNSVRYMSEICKKENIKSISMPRIGCGLDGLKWKDVYGIIEEAFSDCHIKINVYSLE